MKDTLVNNFLRISSIPRMSGNEKEISDYFVNVAKKNNFYYFQDKNNNLLIRKKGNIDKDPIALQSHLDMVCVKTNNSSHDFNLEGINVIIENNVVRAKDTSLGADQGVGLAIMLTILENDSIKHPDLEFLFTVEEETTFKGVETFPYSKLHSKQIINLDNSKDDSVVIGSVGDILNEYVFKSNLIKCDLPCYKVKINGFPGGNAGDNIELSSNNAISTMAKLLKDKDIYLQSINGGTFENDLATSCEIILQTKINIYELFNDFDAKIEKVNSYYSFSKDDSKKIIDEIISLKCGYILNNKASGNIGIVKTIDNEVKIYYLFRSIDENILNQINIESIKLKNDFKVNQIYSDIIWHPNYNSKLLEKYKRIYHSEYNNYPNEVIGQGGTECSSIIKRMPEIDIISIGANIEKYHTTEEITYISSWLKVYNLLINFLNS